MLSVAWKTSHLALVQDLVLRSEGFPRVRPKIKPCL